MAGGPRVTFLDLVHDRAADVFTIRVVSMDGDVVPLPMSRQQALELANEIMQLHRQYVKSLAGG